MTATRSRERSYKCQSCWKDFSLAVKNEIRGVNFCLLLFCSGFRHSIVSLLQILRFDAKSKGGGGGDKTFHRKDDNLRVIERAAGGLKLALEQ